MIMRIFPTLAFLSCLSLLQTHSSQAQKPPDQLEESIGRALSFLKTMQGKDGAWQIASGKSHAVTALSVMAFLAAGHVPGEGPYGPVVDKGIRWVLDHQTAEGLFSSDGHDMYNHGICTLMVAGAAGMTDAKTASLVKPKLEKAVQLILKAQILDKDNGFRGGWRYNVQSADADISVSGWQIMALRAAKNLGCDVPAERIALAMDFVKKCRDPQTKAYCYQPGGPVTIPCTGTCILMLELVGKQGHHTPEALQAGSYLLQNPPRYEQNPSYYYYGVYYCSQAMFQLGQNYWKAFRPYLHKLLFTTQKSNGAWLDDNFGPSYATAMSVLALAVEYRLLPIYQRNEDQDKKAP